MTALSLQCWFEGQPLLVGASVVNGIVEYHRGLDGYVGPKWVGKAGNKKLNLLAF